MRDLYIKGYTMGDFGIRTYRTPYQLGVDRNWKKVTKLDDSIDPKKDGCHMHNHCLTCPLPQCIYDGIKR